LMLISENRLSPCGTESMRKRMQIKPQYVATSAQELENRVDTENCNLSAGDPALQKMMSNSNFARYKWLTFTAPWN